MSKLEWSDFKGFVDTYALKTHWRENSKKYFISAWDGQGLHHDCVINKESPVPDPSDQKEFEDTYKVLGNVSASDGDSTPFARQKVSSKGWTLHARHVEFTTSKLNSLVNMDEDEASYGDVTLKFYNASDVELTDQPTMDTDCVKTVLTWESSNDIEMLGGRMHVATTPTTNCRLWCRAVPDIPAHLGGSKDMITGLNFKFISGAELDGKAVKRMNYDATYHTNKIRKTLRHDAGTQHEFMILWHHYKL